MALALAVAALPAMAWPAAGLADTLPPAPPGLEGRRVDSTDVLAPVPPSQGVGPPARRFAIELDIAPAAAAVPGGGDPAAQRARAAAVDAAADALLARLPAAVTELGRVRVAMAAVLVEAPLAALDALRALPGVRRVDPIVDYQLALPQTVPYVGGTEAQREAGVDGSGVRVAVIDTGVDYTHQALGGQGTSDAYERAYGLSFEEAAAVRDSGAPPPSTPANTRTSDPAGAYFPTGKVVGGFDFVGEAYTGRPGGAREQADPNPIDFQGHGTHVADIIAGGIGMAPGADLVAIKACASSTGACSGVALVQAFDFAVDPNGDGAADDAVDIVNLSLGGDYGIAADDELSRMVEEASARGVLTVAAAGNSGDKPYVHSTPAAAPSALAVAQSSQPGPDQGTVVVSSSRGPTNGANLAKPELAAPGASVSAVVANGTGTEAFGGTSGATPVVAGAAALLLEDDPDRSPGVVKALLQTTAEQGLVLSDRSVAPVTRVGGGELRVDRAVAAPAVVRNTTGDGATLSFGFHDVSQTSTQRRTLVVENPGLQPVSYDVTTEARGADGPAGAVMVTADPREVTVLPGGQAQVEVTVRIDGALLPRWTLDSGFNGGNGALLTGLEHDGAVRFTPRTGTPGPPLVAPLHVLPRAAGDVSTDRSALPEEGGAGVTLRNAGAATATVSTYTLVAENPPPSAGSRGLDLTAVGATTSGTATDVCASGFALSLAMVTAQRVVHANAPFEFSVLVDGDGDGRPDHEIFNADLDYARGGSDGRNATFVFDFATRQTEVVFATDHATNSENTVLTVCGDDLGLEVADLGSPLTLSVRAFDFYYSGAVTDQVPDVVVRPGAERFTAQTVDVAPGAAATLAATDEGADGNYGIGTLSLLDARGSDGRAGTVPGRSALALRASAAEPEPPTEPVEGDTDPPVEPVDPGLPPDPSPSPSPSPLPQAPPPSPAPEPAPSSEPEPAPSSETAPAPSPTPTPSSPTVPGAPPGAGGVERLAGDDRIATAVAVAARAFPDGAPVALLARADAYPDALAGSPLATALGGPLLLNPSDTLHPLVREELRRLGVDQVVLLGGQAAQSEAVADALAAEGHAVRRVSGGNRFATAVAVADEVTALGPSNEVVVVEGADPDPTRGFPDALSAAGLAASQGMPILLTTTEQLPSETADAIEADDGVLVVGGAAAVSTQVAEELDARAATVRRLAGPNRYATSAAVAEEAIQRGLDLSTLWAATGLAFPDALAAGAAAGALDTVVLLVDGRDLAASADSRSFLERRAATIDLVLLAGGEAAVSTSVADDIAGILDTGDRRDT